jgi:predicted amidohydrolase YtcJ
MAAVSLFPLEEEKAELILHNANKATVNSREPRAQAVAISRGRILAVGSDADVLHLGAADCRKIDLGWARFQRPFPLTFITTAKR